MKKIFRVLSGAVICLSVVFAAVSCEAEVEEYKWEGTKLVVSSWPEHVDYIKLVSDNSTKMLNLHDAGEQMTDEYFKGTASLIIGYDRLNDREYDEYFGYGIRSDSQAPFKVYINGVEEVNENPAATQNLYGENLELNVSVDCFRTSFNLTGVKTVEVTFENAPEKILNKDLRLVDDTIYAYVDVSVLLDDFSSVYAFDYNNSSELSRIGCNGLYVFHRYTPRFYVYAYPKSNYYISDTDFAVNLDVATTITIDDRSTESYCYFKVEFDSPSAPYVPAGTVIKLTGGTVTAYDTTNFSGKSLTFAANIPGIAENGGAEVSAASLVLYDDAVSGKTFALSIEGTDWTGTWNAISADESYADPCPRIELETASCSDANASLGTGRVIYHEDQLNSTPGPCWVFENSSGAVRYYFIMTEASGE